MSTDEGSPLLPPAREIALDAGSAPVMVCVSAEGTLAFAACAGRRLTEDFDNKLRHAEILALDVGTGDVMHRIRKDDLLEVWLSSTGKWLLAFAYDLQVSVYDTGQLGRERISSTVPRTSRGFAVDGTGAVYVAVERERELQRIARGERQIAHLDRSPVAVCLGPDDRRLYVSMWSRENVEGRKTGETIASVLTFDPQSLNRLREDRLDDRLEIHTLRLWKKGNALVCMSDDSILDMLPIGEDRHLLAPKRLVDAGEITLIPHALGIDERRSLAYAGGLDEDFQYGVHVVDLKQRSLVGFVPLLGETGWDQPSFSVSPTTDELWLVTNTVDRVAMYGLDDLVSRARQAAKPDKPAVRPEADK